LFLSNRRYEVVLVSIDGVGVGDTVGSAVAGIGVSGSDDESLRTSIAVNPPSEPIDHKTAAASARVTDRWGCNNVV
jgi:hypothetical protein